jgi:hypothetical protein
VSFVQVFLNQDFIAFASPAADVWSIGRTLEYDASTRPRTLPEHGRRVGSYSIRSPEMFLAITRRWISEVPSKMVKILASRCQRSTGYSRV